MATAVQGFLSQQEAALSLCDPVSFHLNEVDAAGKMCTVEFDKMRAGLEIFVNECRDFHS